VALDVGSVLSGVGSVVLTEADPVVDVAVAVGESVAYAGVPDSSAAGIRVAAATVLKDLVRYLMRAPCGDEITWRA
jgi:hypothetical protein